MNDLAPFVALAGACWFSGCALAAFAAACDAVALRPNLVLRGASLRLRVNKPLQLAAALAAFAASAAVALKLWGAA